MANLTLQLQERELLKSHTLMALSLHPEIYLSLHCQLSRLLPIPMSVQAKLPLTLPVGNRAVAFTAARELQMANLILQRRAQVPIPLFIPIPIQQDVQTLQQTQSL